MSHLKHRGGFLSEVAAGLVVSLIAAAGALTASFIFPAPVVARGVVAGIGLVLVLRALSQSREKTGRIVVLSLWLMVSAGAGWLGIGLPFYVALHLMLAWLVRSLYSYSRWLEAALDFGLGLLAVSFAVWAAIRADSIFLAVWCFFLVQALHVTIPDLAVRLTNRPADTRPHEDTNRAFAEAVKAADEALHRIAARR